MWSGDHAVTAKSTSCLLDTPAFGFETDRTSLWKWCHLRGIGQSTVTHWIGFASTGPTVKQATASELTKASCQSVLIEC